MRKVLRRKGGEECGKKARDMKRKESNERTDLKGSEKKSEQYVCWTSFKEVKKAAKCLTGVVNRREEKSRERDERSQRAVKKIKIMKSREEQEEEWKGKIRRKRQDVRVVSVDSKQIRGSEKQRWKRKCDEEK